MLLSHYETLHTQTEAGVHTILLNRPEKRNALTPQLIEDLTQALQAAAANSHCRVVLITGAGSAFCAGLDLEILRANVDAGEDAALKDGERIAALFRTLHELPKPTIAVVNGTAIAGGMGIATLCDLTLAVPEAKFGYTEVRIGFIPAIVSAYLRIQIGDKRARDLLVTGRVIGAEEAAALGLVTRVVAEPELMHEARRLAEKLMQNSPAAMAATKRLLARFGDRRLLDDIDGAIRASAQMRAHPDFREGVTAFLEKREPKWN
jgi:methylglutaconyl-CoA hydratase